LDDLRLVRTWQENSGENLWKGKEDFNVVGGSLGSIFDNQMIRSFYTGFLVRELDGPYRWESFNRSVPNIGTFNFLTSQLIVVLAGGPYRASISLICADGEVLFHQEFSEKELLNWFSASPYGRRFALAIYGG